MSWAAIAADVAGAVVDCLGDTATVTDPRGWSAEVSAVIARDATAITQGPVPDGWEVRPAAWVDMGDVPEAPAVGALLTDGASRWSIDGVEPADGMWRLALREIR